VIAFDPCGPLPAFFQLSGSGCPSPCVPPSALCEVFFLCFDLAGPFSLTHSPYLYQPPDPHPSVPLPAATLSPLPPPRLIIPTFHRHPPPWPLSLAPRRLAIRPPSAGRTRLPAHPDQLPLSPPLIPFPTHTTAMKRPPSSAPALSPISLPAQSSRHYPAHTRPRHPHRLASSSHTPSTAPDCTPP